MPWMYCQNTRICGLPPREKRSVQNDSERDDGARRTPNLGNALFFDTLHGRLLCLDDYQDGKRMSSVYPACLVEDRLTVRHLISFFTALLSLLLDKLPLIVGQALDDSEVVPEEQSVPNCRDVGQFQVALERFR